MTDRAQIHLRGQIGGADFEEWIKRHAQKLAVKVSLNYKAKDTLLICASGPGELITALALACSLGPQSVLVDTMDITFTDQDNTTQTTAIA